MRGLLAGLALLALLAPLAAATEPCAARLCIDAGYPGPGARVVVHQDPDCFVHEAFWEGAWMSGADASRWFWSDRSTGGAQALSVRPLEAAQLVGEKAAWLAVDGASRTPGFAADPTAVPLWALGAMGDEDLCVLGVVEVTTGASGP